MSYTLGISASSDGTRTPSSAVHNKKPSAWILQDRQGNTNTDDFCIVKIVHHMLTEYKNTMLGK